MINCQLALNDALSIASHPNASWVGIARKVAFNMELMALQHDAIMSQKPKA